MWLPQGGQGRSRHTSVGTTRGQVTAPIRAAGLTPRPVSGSRVGDTEGGFLPGHRPAPKPRAWVWHCLLCGVGRVSPRPVPVV